VNLAGIEDMNRNIIDNVVGIGEYSFEEVTRLDLKGEMACMNRN
jgi:hypothetical protein